ncbi:MAG: superoxide dismutase [Thermodesulfobacteriota bacterium]
MKILAIERDLPNAQPDDFKNHLRAEAVRVWELQQADVLREIYFRQDRSEAVLILECADIKEARRILDTLPLVQAGLIAFDLIPLKPYPGLSRLFA